MEFRRNGKGRMDGYHEFRRDATFGEGDQAHSNRGSGLSTSQHSWGRRLERLELAVLCLNTVL